MLFVALLLASFVPLLGGADLVVRGSSAVARRLNVSPLVVGLTLVAMGTSAPELVINLSAAFAGQDSIAVGNVLGSNIFNVAVVLGVLAIIMPLPISRNTTWAEIPLALLAAVVLFVVMADRFLNGSAIDVITRSEGILLLSFFGIFLAYTVQRRRGDTGELLWETPSTPSSLDRSLPLALVVAIAGFALLALGGRGVVAGAVGTASLLGVPEYIIAVTVVAIGTSLPELVTSLVAGARGNTDLAVGNIIGSNIFNVFLVLGATAAIRPVAAPHQPVDHAVHLVLTGLLFLFVFTGPGRQIQRWEGLILVLVYIAYMTMLVITTIPG